MLKERVKKMKVFIGCSSYDIIDKKYFEEGSKIASFLASKNNSLIFGGSSHGLMGCVYNEFKKQNRDILAIQIEKYKEDLNDLECNKKLLKNVYDQLVAFMNESDVLIYLPGGYGTYNEIFYMMCEYINESHNKPIIIYNINGYYDEIDKILNKMKEEKFAKKFNFVKIVNNLDEFKSIMEEIC